MARDFRFGVRITGDDRGAVRAMGNVGQRSRRLNEELGNLNRRTRTTGERFRGWASSMSRAVRSIDPLRAAVGGAGLAAGLGFMVKRTTAAADETQRLADIAGVATGEFSTLSAVMERAGGNAPALSDAIKELQVRSSEFAEQGTGEAAESFDALFGDRAREKVGRLQDDAGAFFRTTLERISEIDSQARRTQLLDELFGGQGGEQLILLLDRVDERGGRFSETLREMEQAAKDSGEALSGDQIEALSTLNRELDAAGRTIRNSFAAAIAENEEDIRSFVNLLSEGAEAAVDFAAGIGAMARRWESEEATEQIQKTREELAHLVELRDRLSGQFGPDEELPAHLFVGTTSFRGEDLGDLDQAIQRLREQLQGYIRDTFNSGDAADDASDAQKRQADMLREVNAQLDFLDGFGETASGSLTDLQKAFGMSADEAKALNKEAGKLLSLQGEFDSMFAGFLRDRAASDVTSMEGAFGNLGTEAASDSVGGAEQTEAMRNASSMMDRIDRQMQSMNQTGKDLGMTFTSAFEDAVIGGESFRDVLQGAAEDISRIILRRNITEPAAEAIGSFDWSSLFSSGGGSTATGTGSSPAIAAGDSYAGGGYTGDGPRSGGLDGRGGFMAMMHPRETVIDHTRGGGPSVVVNIHGEGGEDAEVEERSDGRGGSVIDVFMPMVASGIQQGKLDSALTKRFQGLKPRVAGRG